MVGDISKKALVLTKDVQVGEVIYKVRFSDFRVEYISSRYNRNSPSLEPSTLISKPKDSTVTSVYEKWNPPCLSNPLKAPSSKPFTAPKLASPSPNPSTTTSSLHSSVLCLRRFL
jgi:hypothetical protein